MSHGLSAYSQKPSARPPATWQQSIAAEPSRRMPCTGARRNAVEHRELDVERRTAVVGEAGDDERVLDASRRP